MTHSYLVACSTVDVHSESFIIYSPILSLKMSYIIQKQSTVNSEIFARILFSRNFAYAKFRENKLLAKWRNHYVVY